MPLGSPRDSSAAPTLSSVADRAGVSRQTVSNAMNNPELLRPDTLARVQSAISELGYSPNRAARSLRTRSSRLIGLRFPAVDEATANTTMDRFVHSLVEAADSAGYQVLLFASDEDEDPVAGYDHLLRATAVDAFVLTDTYLGNPQAAWLAERRAPFVSFGRPWHTPEATHPWVDVDGAAGTGLAANHLLERGHSKVAWVGWSDDSVINTDRRAGWERAMYYASLDTSDLEQVADDTVAGGRAAAAALLDRGATGFVCASDTLAIGVMHELQARGITPGQGFGVVGFDDSQAAQMVLGGLTSVRQPLEQVAIELLRRLEGLLGAGSSPDEGLLLGPSLVVRGSS